jgi:peptide/nickel transport system substrate-binding protein
MQAKEGDIVLVEFGKQAADHIAIKDLKVFVQPQATSFVIFDDKNADSPFYNKKVREAVDYAIDRQWLADNLGFGMWKPAYQLPPSNNKAYDPTWTGRKYDLNKAKQLLTEAGFPNGFKTELLPNPTAVNRDIWVAVQSQLAKAGINAELKFLEPGKFAEYRNTGTWKNAIVQDTVPSYGNYNTSLDQMFAPQAGFFQSMDKARPDWAAAYEATSKTETMDAALVQKACRILYENASVIPVTEGGRGYAYQSYVKDGGFGERGAYFWAWAWEKAWLDK